MRAQGGALIGSVLALAGAAVSLPGAIMLGGCASRQAPSTVDNSLDRLLADARSPATIDSPAAPRPDRSRSELEERMDATVHALERALAADPRPAASEPGSRRAPPAASTAPTLADDSAPADTVAADEAEPAAAEAPEPVSLAELPAHRLADALAQRAWADSAASDDPFALAVTLAFLESQFDFAGPDAAGMGGPGADLYRRLTPGQRQSLSAMRHLAHEALRGEAASGETGPVADVLDTLVFSLWDRDPVRIGRVALCEEVRRYGDYDAFQSSRFLAGETARMVVYVELDRFTNVPDGAGWKVDLSLEINVFSETGRTLVWRMPQTPYTLTSSRRLRDVFLPALVELPPTLGAGRYTLKAIVRDRSDGSVDEQIVAVDLVADPGLR